jgi:carbonic anhydrase
MLRMKRFFVGITAVVFFTLSFGQAFASGGKAAVTADEALKMLMDGNVRFVESKQELKKLGDERRKELAKGQNPIAIILSCSDSRVPPEHIFNQGLGDIFVVRVAGNVADPIELGSVEYAAEHLNVPLVVVLGHKFCGAVKATVAGGKPEGNIDAIVKKINPAVDIARKKAKDKDALLDAAIDENAKLTAKTLTEKSDILKHLVHEGKLKIVVGVYNLSTGKVELLEGGEEGKASAEHSGHKH